MFTNKTLVGKDKQGNKYYQARKRQNVQRFVEYKGLEEPTKVPSEWYAWLHFISDRPPQGSGKLFDWEKDRLPNFTGTSRAYCPPGHILNSSWQSFREGRRAYSAWKP